MSILDNILSFFKGKPAAALVTKKTSPAKAATAAEVAKFLNSKARIVRVHPNARRLQKRRKAAKNQHVTDWHWLNKIDNSYVVTFTMEYFEGVGTLQFTADVDVEKKYVFNVYWGDIPPTPPPPHPGSWELEVENSEISLNNVKLYSDLWQFGLREIQPGRAITATIKVDEKEHLLLPEAVIAPIEDRHILVYIEQQPPDKQVLAIEGNDTPTPTLTILNNIENEDVLKLGFIVASAIDKFFVFENMDLSADNVEISGLFDGIADVAAGEEVTGWLGNDTGTHTITLSTKSLSPDIGIHLMLKLSNPDWARLFNYNNDANIITLTVDTDDELFKDINEIRIRLDLYYYSINYFQVQINNSLDSLDSIQETSTTIPDFAQKTIGINGQLLMNIYEIEKAYNFHLSPSNFQTDTAYRFVHATILPDSVGFITLENNDTQDVTVNISDDNYYMLALPILANVFEVNKVAYSIQLTFRNTDLSQTIDSNIPEFNGTFRNTNIKVNTNNLAVTNYINVYGSGTPGKVMRVESTGNVNPGMTITKINDQQAKIEWTRTGAENEFQYRIGIYEQ